MKDEKKARLACLLIVLGSLISIRFSMVDESTRIMGYIYRSNPELTKVSREEDLKHEQRVRLFFKGISALSIGFAAR
jgi:hypothetical protein